MKLINIKFNIQMLNNLQEIKEKAKQIIPYIDITISILYGTTLIGLMLSQVTLWYTVCFFIIPTALRFISKMKLDQRNEKGKIIKVHWLSTCINIFDPSQAFFAKIFPTVVAMVLYKIFDINSEISLNLSLGFIRVVGHPFLIFSMVEIVKKFQGNYQYEEDRPKFYRLLILSITKQGLHIAPYLLLALTSMSSEALLLTSMGIGRFCWSVVKHYNSRKRAELPLDLMTKIDPLYCFALSISFSCASLVGHCAAEQVGIALFKFDISINSIMISFILYYVQCICRDLTYKALKYTSQELGWKTPILSLGNS